MAESSSPFRKILYPAWQHEYEAARLERDPAKLLQRAMEAETAIFNRLQALAGSIGHEAERQAIGDALEGLRVLKRGVLGFPDWKQE